MKTKIRKISAAAFVAAGTLLGAANLWAIDCGDGYMACSGTDSANGSHEWCCPTANGGYCGGWIEATQTESGHGGCHSNTNS